MTEPHTLDELLRWIRQEFDDAIPIRLHSRDLSAGGTPEWHRRLQAWLMAPPSATDRDGYIADPLKFWLWKLSSQAPKAAQFIRLLATFDFDAAAASRVAFDFSNREIPSRVFAHSSIRRLFRLMYSVAHDGTVTPNEPIRSERGDCAERGCTNKTTRLRCKAHEKSDAQIDAEMAGR